MVLASEEDRAPVMQLWDLRFAASPVKMFEKHEKGILSIAWCPHDSELLLSAGKDNNVYCWNPNSEQYGGEVVYEVPSTSQWCFNVQWCPRHPGLISTASFDGRISIYSLLGGSGADQGKSEPQASVPVDPSDPFSGIGSKPVQKVTEPLKKPPKWLRRPCAARFGFGGKLVSFGPSAPTTVSISQVTTEVEFVARSEALESALSEGDFSEYCSVKMDNAPTQQEKDIWEFMKVTFEAEPRQQFLQLLGYNAEELEQKLSDYIGTPSLSSAATGNDLDISALSQKMESLAQTSTIDDDFNLVDLSSTVQQSTAPAKFDICTSEDVDGQLSRALLVGNFTAAVEICLKEDRMADALVLAVAGGSELFSKTQQVFFDRNQSKVKRLMSAVVNRSWSDIATNASLDNWREVLAALVTFAGPEDFAPLCDLLGDRMEREASGAFSEHACLCYICSGNVDKFIDCWRKSTEDTCSPVALQDLVEKVVLLKKAVEKERRQQKETTHPFFVEKLCLYSSLLASQGNLKSAYSYLKHTTGAESDLLRDRLYHAQTYKPGMGVAPATPFEPASVSTVQPSAPSTVNQPTASTQLSSGGVYGTGVGGTTSYPQGTVYGGHTGQQPGYHSTAVVTQPGPVYKETFQPPPPTSHVGSAYAPPPPIQPTMQVPGGKPTLPSNLAPIQGSPSQPRKPNQPLSYMYRNDEPGWNDPPMLQKPKAKPPTPVSVSAPIMNPMPTVQTTVPSDTGPAVMVPSGSSSYQEPQPKVTTPVTPQAPEPPIEKTPIPAEYVPMVTTFVNMAERTRTAAVNQALKRKVDEVNKKLEALQDLLREKKLSQSTIQGLSYIAQAIESHSYQQGLEQYHAMVTTASFSEIGPFIPGIKVLLQLGLQLNI
jgi:protein transport protein SEC31